MKTKVWVDDLRPAPEGWRWCKTSREAIRTLAFSKIFGLKVSHISLDHDLGGDDTTRPVVLWMCEHEFWPKKVLIHTQNPVGHEWLSGMVKRYKK